MKTLILTHPYNCKDPEYGSSRYFVDKLCRDLIKKYEVEYNFKAGAWQTYVNTLKIWEDGKDIWTDDPFIIVNFEPRS